MGVANVAAGKPKVGGAVYVGATSLTLPTDSTTALAAGFTSLGYCSDAGLVQSIERESEDVKAWGGDTVLTTQTGYSETYKCTLIETLSVDVKKAAFGDSNVTGALATGITTKGNSKELEQHAWVVEMIQNGATVRKVLPLAKVIEVGEITYSDSDAIGYEITIKALPDSSGNCSYEYAQKS